MRIWAERLRPMVGGLILGLLLGPLLGSMPAAGGDLAGRACAALALRVNAVAGDGPVFLRSYETAEGAPLAEPALGTAAFTYDNALAVVALLACGQEKEARRVGAALRLAVGTDRHWTDGRLRNAYRAGAADSPPLPPGWWNPGAGRWEEDAYLVGTATGNVAWAALALLALHDTTGDESWLRAAERTLGWVLAKVAATEAIPSGLSPGVTMPARTIFRGGLHGHEPAPTPLTWVATEHAVDLAAAFGRLARAVDRQGAARWRKAETDAHDFVQRMWDGDQGRFVIGLLPDGWTPNRAGSGLDAQLWPLLLGPVQAAEWRRSLEFVTRAHAADGGFDFNDDRDGMWVEGTAQAALAFRAVGNRAEAERLLAEVAKEFAPGGLLFATRSDSLTTGLAIGPDSSTADFLYFRRGHVGATAWAALAALGWNPFTGRPVE